MRFSGIYDKLENETNAIIEYIKEQSQVDVSDFVNETISKYFGFR
jgi:hypothetical protein